MSNQKLIDVIWEWGKVQGDIGYFSGDEDDPECLRLKAEAEKLWDKIVKEIGERSPCKR